MATEYKQGQPGQPWSLTTGVKHLYTMSCSVSLHFNPNFYHFLPSSYSWSRWCCSPAPGGQLTRHQLLTPYGSSPRPQWPTVVASHHHHHHHCFEPALTIRSFHMIIHVLKSSSTKHFLFNYYVINSTNTVFWMMAHLCHCQYFFVKKIISMNYLVSANFSNIHFLGPHFCCRGSPLGPHFTQHWVLIGSPLH